MLFTQAPFLEELRKALIIIVGALLVAFLAFYSFAEKLFLWVAEPMQRALPPGSSLVFISAVEPFFTHLKAAAMAGLFICLPLVLWQFWRLLAWYLQLRRPLTGFLFVLASSLFFYSGAYLGFVYVLPTIFKVLINFGTEGGEMEAKLAMGAYFSLAVKMVLAFGLVGELPVIILLLARLGVVDHVWLSRQRKYMIIFAFAFGAVITPGPDVLSQASIAIPFIVLYEVGTVAARLFGRKRAPAEEDAPAA